jgi:hypothetical protein
MEPESSLPLLNPILGQMNPFHTIPTIINVNCIPNNSLETLSLLVSFHLTTVYQVQDYLLSDKISWKHYVVFFPSVSSTCMVKLTGSVQFCDSLLCIFSTCTRSGHVKFSRYNIKFFALSPCSCQHTKMLHTHTHV